MESLLLVVHVVIALAIIGLIMLQQGKGAEMGASFGAGSSQTVFGAAGSGNFFSRMTAILAAVFFVTSFTLAVFAKSTVSTEDSEFDIGVAETISAEAVEDGADVTVPTLDASGDDLAPAVVDDTAAEDEPAPQVPQASEEE